MTEREMDMKKKNEKLTIDVLSNKELDAKIIYARSGPERRTIMGYKPEEIRWMIKDITRTILNDPTAVKPFDKLTREMVVCAIVNDIRDELNAYHEGKGIVPEIKASQRQTPERT